MNRFKAQALSTLFCIDADESGRASVEKISMTSHLLHGNLLKEIRPIGCLFLLGKDFLSLLSFVHRIIRSFTVCLPDAKNKKCLHCTQSTYFLINIGVSHSINWDFFASHGRWSSQLTSGLLLRSVNRTEPIGIIERIDEEFYRVNYVRCHSQFKLEPNLNRISLG